jgi:hypothetical protein
MKTLFFSAAVGLLFCIPSVSSAKSGDDDFNVILDESRTDNWKHVGSGAMEVRDGVATTVSPKNGHGGIYGYEKKPFGDFDLKLEFKIDTETSNSGIFVRMPDPANGYEAAVKEAYEIDICGARTGTILFNHRRARTTVSVPLHPGKWNECEVIVMGQHFTVKLRGQQVIEYTGSHALSGYIGLQTLKGEGEVHFRNVRIKDLPSTTPVAAIAAGAPVNREATCIEILSKQAPNALEWALAPLDRTTPSDIRQNLTYLREDMLDEAAKKPAASAEAYKFGEQVCNDLIAALNERDQARVHAGFTAAQAKVNMGEITNQALEARRSSRAMAWPTYQREKDQREVLRKAKENAAALENQRPILEWADRGAQIRKMVDALYAQYREAARRPASAK